MTPYAKVEGPVEAADPPSLMSMLACRPPTTMAQFTSRNRVHADGMGI